MGGRSSRTSWGSGRRWGSRGGEVVGRGDPCTSDGGEVVVGTVDAWVGGMHYSAGDVV